MVDRAHNSKHPGESVNRDESIRELGQKRADSKGAASLKKPDDGHGGTLQLMEKVCELAKLGLYSMHDYAASSIPLNKPEGNKDIHKDRTGNDKFIGIVNQSRAWWYKETLKESDAMLDRFIRSEEFQKARNLVSRQEALENAEKNFRTQYNSLRDAVSAATDHYKFIESLEPDKIVKARQIQFIKMHVEPLKNYGKAASDRATNLKSFYEGVLPQLEAIKKIIRDSDKANKASQDQEALENIITKLEGFKKALQEAEAEAEIKGKNAVDATNEISNIIEKRGSTVNNIEKTINSNKVLIAEVKAAEEKILSNGGQVLEALKRYRERTNYQNQAIEKLRKLNERLISEERQKEEERTKPYLPIDMGQAKLSLPDEQGKPVWFELRNINKFTRIDDNTTEVKFRPDLTEITLSRQSRDAGKAELGRIYTKRLLNEEIETADYKLTLRFDSDSFINYERRLGTLTYIDKKAEKEERAAAEKEGRAVKEERFKSEKSLDMERSKSIHLLIDLVNEKNSGPSISFTHETVTMPARTIKHDQVLKPYGPEATKTMTRFHLPTQEIIGANGKRIPFADIDWTETLANNQEGEGGVVFRLAGPPDVSYIRVDTALSMAGIGEESLKLERETKEAISKYLEQSLQDLENALRTRDKGKIAEAFNRAEKMKWHTGSIINGLKDKFDRIPRDRLQSEAFHKAKSQMVPETVAIAERYLEQVEKLQNTSTDCNKEMQESILALFSRSIRDFLPTRPIDTKPMVDKWQELSDAEHFDQVIDSGLLKNPLMAETFIKELAEKVGEATYSIEYIKTQNDNLAKAAQKKAEKDISDEVNQALSTYIDDRKISEDSDSGYDSGYDSDNDNDKSLETFHTTVRNAINRAILLKGKADAAKATQEFAQLVGDIPGNPSQDNAKADYISKAKEDCATKSGSEILDYIVKTARNAVEIQERKKNPNDKMVRPVLHIDNAIRMKAKEAKEAENGIFRQNIAAITAAREEAIRVLGERGEGDGEMMYQDAKKSPYATPGEEQITDEASKLEEKTKQATEDAEKEWKKEYALILARNAIENIDKKSEATIKRAEEEPEAARAKTAYYLAAVEIEKLGVARDRLAASKEKDVNARRAAYKDAMDVQYAADSVQTQVSQPVNADGRGHVRIDEETGHLIMGSNHGAAAVHFYLQDVAIIGNAQTYGAGTRDTHTGMGFKETLQIPAGNPIDHWDVDHNSHLSAADDDWTKRTYLRFLVDDGQGGHVDMLHLPDGREIPFAYIDFDKTEHSSKDGITIVLKDGNAVPADQRGCKYNLKRIAQAVQGNLTEVGQHEAAARLAAGEAIKKRLWLQAEEEVLQAARTSADLRELPKTVPATAPQGTRSEYETAINEARDRFTAFANTAKNDVKNNLKRSDADPADGTRGDIDEKNAAWLEAALRYAQGQKRIADATKKAVDAAEAAAKALGKDVKAARQRAEQVVRGLSDLAQKSADGTSGDGFEAVVSAAEKAAATEVAIAENKSKAADHARHGEQLVGIEQEGTALRVAEGIEIGSTAAGNAVGTASVDASRTKARDVAQKYARLRGDANPDTAANAANQVITAKITAIETQIDTDITANKIPDEKLRNEVRNVLKDMAKARVAAQWAMVEHEKLSAALEAQKCARVSNITAENTLRTEATNAINDVDQCVAEATANKHPAEAGAAAVVAAKKHRALLQAKAVTAQAEKTIAGLTGGDDATQTDAVRRVLGGGLIDGIYDQGGLVAVVRYAESRIQVKEAVVRADQTARQMAAQRGLPELTPTNVGDPTQATKGQAAARSVRDRAQAIRDGNESDPNAQDIQSAEAVAPGAKQAITDAINQVQTIKDLARADHEITAQMTARTATAERYAAAEAEIADLVMEAPDQETKREVFEAAKLSQARAKVVKYTKDIQRAIGADDQALRTAVENAKQTLGDRYKKGGLAAAVRYAEYLDQVAKSAIKASHAAHAALAAVQAAAQDAQAAAQDAATKVNNQGNKAWRDNAGDPEAQDVAGTMAAARLAESYVQINTAIQRLRDTPTLMGNLQQSIAALRDRVTAARGEVARDAALDPAMHPAKFAARTAQHLIDGTDAADANALDRDTDNTRLKVKEAQESIQGAGLAARQAVTDASDQPYAIKEYHGDRDEEYKVAIKAARETRVAQKIRIFKEGEAVEKSGAIASNRVKGSASQASRELMQQIATAQVPELEQDRDPDRVIQRAGLDTVKESVSQASRKLMQQFATAQVPELEQVRDPEQVSRRLLDTTKSEAEKNVEKYAKKIARLLYGNNVRSLTKRNTYVENAKSTFESIVHNTERMSLLRGEDRITQHAAIAEAVTSYAAYLTELTSATRIASRDAAAIATLAGRNDKSYARETAKAVLLRADIARHEAVLEGKSPIDQYAAAAAGARRFAQVQVELGRSAKAAAKAAEDRARAEGLPAELPTNAGPNDRSQETAKQKAAGKVIDAFSESRRQAAQEKSQQAYANLVIFAREMAETRGDPNVQTTVDNILGEPTVPDGEPRADSVKDRERQARDELKYLGDEAAIEEGVAQVIAAQVAIVRAKRDVARSVKTWAEVQGVPNLEQNRIIQQEIEYIDAEANHGRNERGGNVLDQDIVASEIAACMAARQHAIESATKDASTTAERMGSLLGDEVNPATQRGGARSIEYQIMAAIEGVGWTRGANGVQRGSLGIITHEIKGGKNYLNAHRFAAEFAAQVASTQHSRLTAALAARKAAISAGLPATVPQGAAADERSEQTEAYAAVGGIDATINNNNVRPFLPADIPRGYRDILRAPFKARLALRAATAKVKIAQAVQASTKKAREATARTIDPAHPNPAALDTAGQSAARHTLNAVNDAITAGGTSEEALVIALQEAEACHKIANMVGEVEENARYSARIAGHDQAAQDRAGREAVQRLLNAANEVWQAGGRNQALEAVQAAQKFASSEAQIKNAVERLFLNDQASAQQNADNLLTHVTQARAAAPAAQRAIDSARAAAQGAENLIQGNLVDQVPVPGDAVDQKGVEAERAMLKDVAEESREFDGIAIFEREIEIARTLDDIEAVARNPEVAQAMNDAGRSAAAAEELKRRDIAAPAEAELAAEAEAEATNKASLAVLRSAVAARQVAKAEKLSENVIKSRESEAANSTAARFVSRHAVAVSTKEIAIAKLGDPYTQPPPADAAAIQDEIAGEVQAATDRLDTTLRNGAAEKAGLRLDATTRELMLDPAVAADSLINEAKIARRQLGKISGQSVTQQKKDANDLQAEIIRQANEVKRAVEANGGDDMEGTLAAVAFIERRVAIERAVTDAVLAKRETIQLTGEDEEAREFIKYVRDQVEATQKATKEQGMDLAAQIAAGAAEATNIAQFEKNMRDRVRDAITPIDPKDRKTQIDIAKKSFAEIINNARKLRKEIAQEVISPLVAKSLQKYTNKARELKTAAYQGEVPQGEVPHAERLPQLLAPTDNEPQEMKDTYNTNRNELITIIKESKSKLMEKYTAAINDEKRKGKNILDQNRAGIAAVMGDIALTESIIDMQNARMSNIANPGGNAPVANRMQYNKDLRSARINAEKEIQDVYNKAFDGATRKGISERYAIAAAAVKSYVLIEKSVIDAKNVADASIPVLAAAQPPTQDDRDIHIQQTEDAKIDAEVRVRNAVKTILDAAAGKDPIEQYAVAAQAAFREAGNANQDDSSAEVYKAGRDIEVAAATMRDTVRVGQRTFAAAKSSVFRARIVEIERAIKGLTPEQAEEVRNTAKKVYDDATASNKDLIAQHADAADAGVRKAYELREGDTDSKTLARVGNEAKQAVEAAAANTEADIAKASGGTDIQTTTAKNAARCATARADIAQAIKVVGPHARTRATQLAGLNHAPAATPDTATQLVAKNIMQLVAATQAVGTDSVTVLENGATAARAYVAGLVGEDVLGPNQTAATGAKGLAARAQHYASKGADRDTATKDAAITDVAHHCAVSETAAFLIAEDRVVTSSIHDVSDVLGEGDLNREQLQRAITTLKELSQSHKGNDPQKSKETIEALTKVVTEQDGLARDLKKVADIVQAGAQAAGLNVKQQVSKFAREVKDAAIEKQRDVLEAERATTLRKVRNSVQGLRNQPPINGYTHLNPGDANNVGTLQKLLNEADIRIQAEANKPLDPAKDPITQYTERIAAVKAQGAIESARIKIITSWEEAMRVSGRRPLTPAQIHTKNQRVDTIVQAAKTHADPDNRNIIQQHIAAAATAQKLASLYEQFHEVVMAAPPAQRQNMYRSSMHQSQIIHRLRGQGGPNFLIQNVIAMLDFAKREALQQANAAGQPTEEELAREVTASLQTVDKSGETGSKTAIDAISEVQDKSDKASRDGARQAVELGQTVGETLQAIVEAAKKAEAAINLETGKYTKWLAAIAMDIDRQADQEAHNKKLSRDQRIQARTETLMQAREVIVELARSMEDTANVTRTSRLAALEDKDVANRSAYQEAIEVLNVFNKKRADIQAANGDLSTRLRAGEDAAIRFAESSVIIYKAIQDLAEQTTKNLNALSISKEQKEQIVIKTTKDALKEIKQRRTDAIAQGHDIGSKEFAAISRCAGMEVLLRMRRDTILSTQAIDNTLNAEAKKVEDEVAVSPAYDKQNPLQFFEQYTMYLENPNPDPAEQASLKKIEAFFEKENNGVHDYWQNQYYLKRAIEAARRRHFHFDKSAGDYITRMKLVPKPDSTSKKPEDLRQGFERDWVSSLKEAVQHAIHTGSDEVIGQALMGVAERHRKYYSNLKLAEKALDPKTSREEALKALDDMDLAKVPLPTLPGENVTNPKAVADRHAKAILEQKLNLEQLEARTDADIAKQNNALSKFFLESAMLAYEGLCENAASNPELLAALKAEPQKWVDSINKQLWETYKRDDSKRYEMMKMKFYQKEANRQFWRGALKDWALLTIRNAIDAGNRAEKDVMDQLFKIIKQSLG